MSFTNKFVRGLKLSHRPTHRGYESYRFANEKGSWLYLWLETKYNEKGNWLDLWLETRYKLVVHAFNPPFIFLLRYNYWFRNLHKREKQVKQHTLLLTYERFDGSSLLLLIAASFKSIFFF